MALNRIGTMVDLVVILGTPRIAVEISKVVASASEGVVMEQVATLEHLEKVSQAGATNPLLVSAGTGVIVPRHVLDRFPAGAVNFHAASPEYPGRDTHHFAAYDQCRRYGATAHIMTERVDEGPILDVEEEPVEPGARPEIYRSVGRRCLMRLIPRIIPRLLSQEAQPTREFVWGGTKTSRRDFQSLCRMDPLSDEEETARRMRAVEMPGYANAYVDLAGYRFRIEGLAPSQEQGFRHHEEDFTEASYIDLLARVADRYQFIGFDSAATAPERSVLWRHDIDFSVHRARRLASLEAERGLQATYFVLPGCRFYNMLEPETRRLLQEIVSDGHDIGLHFDPTVLGERADDQASVEERIAWETGILKHLLDAPIAAVSIHNPDSVLPWLTVDYLGGLVNTYGARLHERYAYVSDSNGIWGHRRLLDVVMECPPCLHVLTHPAWWVPDPMKARARIRRAVEGRARKVMQDYDRALARDGRLNVQ